MSLNAQAVCPDSLMWSEYMSNQFPNDLSFYTFNLEEVNMGDQKISFEHTDVNNVGSVYNNSIYEGILGGLSNVLILSVEGSSDGVITKTITFDPPVYDLSFSILDIDQHEEFIWQDEITVAVKSNGLTLPINASNIHEMGNCTRFDDTTDMFYGVCKVENFDPISGNVDLNFGGPIEEIFLSYEYGQSTSEDYGLQVIGLSNLHFKSDANCRNIVAVDDELCLGGLDDFFSFNPLDNDIEGSFSISPSSLTVINDNTLGEILNISSKGDIFYEKSSSAWSTDILQYEICDVNGICDTAQIKLVNGGEIEYLFAEDDQKSMFTRQTISGNVLLNDISSSQTKVITEFTKSPGGSFELNSDGSYHFVPDTNFSGVYTCSYTVCNPARTICDDATLYIHVIPMTLEIEDEFLFMSTELIINNSGMQSFDLKSFISKSNGTNSFVFMNNTATSDNISLSQDGILTVDTNKVIQEQLSIRVIDPVTGNYKDALFNILSRSMVLSECEPAVLQSKDDIAFTCTDTDVSINVSANDHSDDAFVTKTYSVVDNVNHGNLVFGSTGTAFYTPEAGYMGNDEMTYEVCFSKLENVESPIEKSSVSNTSIPNGVAQVYSPIQIEEEGFIENVRINNIMIDHQKPSELSLYLVDPNGNEYRIASGFCDLSDQLSFSIASNASNNIIPCPSNGAIITPQTPLNNLIGQSIKGVWFLKVEDSNTGQNAGTLTSWDLEFVYQVEKTLSCQQSTLSILVISKPEAPILEEDCYILSPDNILTINVLENDTDINNDLDRSTLVFDQTNLVGQISTNDDGSIIFTSDEDFVGETFSQYTVCDTLGLCSDTQVKFMISKVLADSNYEFNAYVKDLEIILFTDLFDDLSAYSELQYEELKEGNVLAISDLRKIEKLSDLEYSIDILSGQNRRVFRVNLVTHDGRVDYSEWKEVYIDRTNDNYTVYPNFIEDQFRIITPISSNTGELKISIFDIQGQRIYSKSCRVGETITWPSSFNTAGLYIVTIKSKNQKEKSIRVYKQ